MVRELNNWNKNKDKFNPVKKTMQWYYVAAIVVAILVAGAGIVTAIIKGIWTLATIFGDVKVNIATLTAKVENVQLSQNSLQARTIRLEEKVDNLGH